MSSSKKLTSVASVYLSEAPPILGFCLGWSSNYVGSESGQIQNMGWPSNFVGYESGQIQNMVSNRTQHPQPLPTTYCLYILYFEKREGGGGGLEP